MIEVESLLAKGLIDRKQADFIINGMFGLRNRYGLSFNQMHNSLVALGNIIIAGRLSVCEFRQFFEPMPGCMTLMAILERVDYKDYMQAMQRGEISSKLFLSDLNYILGSSVTELPA